MSGGKSGEKTISVPVYEKPSISDIVRLSQLAVPDSMGPIFSPVRLLLYCVQKRGLPFVIKGCSMVL